MTGGLSLLATGVKNGKSGTEMIPVKNISSVTTRRDGIMNSFVSIITSGNTIDFRVSHGEAATVKTVVTDLILGKYDAAVEAAAAPVPEPAPTAAPGVDVTEQIAKLASLRDAGVLTDEEFTTKKAELLARL
ncbi:SHOCT domain-containing protein [Homoserinibacter sp. GY 40078]|nr:SHOCT domain-containing protein [Homoserinibacter sp. GY 40078]